MRIVHHLENSRSLRVLWMLEELGLDYELRRYPRDPKTLLAPPELRNVHPLGKSPVLQDGELVLAESGAILDYLADRYDTQRQLSPSPMPADGAERIAYRYWLHYAEGSAMPPLLLTLVMGRIRNAPMPFFARPIDLPARPDGRLPGSRLRPGPWSRWYPAAAAAWHHNS